MLYVIMSVYKGDHVDFVKGAIESLFNQSYGDFQLYLTYDGPVSKDIDEYLTSMYDDRLHIYKNNKNQGLATVLNEMITRILKKTDAEFIARMDADDIAVNDRFEKQIIFFRRHDDIEILGGYITESETPELGTGKVVKYPTEHEQMRLFFGKRNPLAHPTVMMRRSFFEKAGLYPTNGLRSEDTQLWLKGFQSGCTFANIPEILVHMRVNPQLFGRRNGKAKSKNDYILRKQVIKELGLPKKYERIAYIRYLLFAYSTPFMLKLAYKYLR